jgi:hypothetical protein
MEQGKEPGKEKYEPPQIVKVKLVRDEMAATGCKSSSGAGPTGAGCRGTFPPLGVCRQPGS